MDEGIWDADDPPIGTELGNPSVRMWLERLLGRRLGDVRVHDSALAGDLARRLGARALALLAHESAHAAEQLGSGPAPRPPGPYLQRSVARRAAGPTIPAAPGEALAEAAEEAALAAQRPATRRQHDADAVAERVYRLMADELRLAGERWPTRA